MEKFEKSTIKDFENPACLNVYESSRLFNEFVQFNNEKHYNNYRIVTKFGTSPNPQVYNPYTGELKEMVSFVSNDYLGLTKHPRIINAGIEALKTYGSGAGSSPLIGGVIEIHEELDRELARFCKKEAAISFTSGYAANCGSLSVLMHKEDIALLDMGVHASVIEGCYKTNTKFFLHNDIKSLQHALEQVSGNYRNIFIIVDGVYSQDGDISDLPAICKLAKEFGAFLVVDDAHGIGVVGKNGMGILDYYNCHDQVDLYTGTFSKSFGSVGGFVAGKAEIITYLKYMSDSNIFSAAATPQSVATVLEALHILKEETHWHKQLRDNIQYFKSGLETIGVDYLNSNSAIFPVMIRDERKTMEVGRLLLEKNIYANPIPYPAVARKQTRIRMSLMATHTKDMLDYALNVLEDVLNSQDVKRRWVSGYLCMAI